MVMEEKEPRGCTIFVCVYSTTQRCSLNRGPNPKTFLQQLYALKTRSESKLDFPTPTESPSPYTTHNPLPH